MPPATVTAHIENGVKELMPEIPAASPPPPTVEPNPLVQEPDSMAAETNPSTAEPQLPVDETDGVFGRWHHGT